MKTVIFENKEYPEHITKGFHSRFIFPIAKEICKGKGLDIGCGQKDWAFPGARPIDMNIYDKYNAYVLPTGKYDYIFSSHCLEHLTDYVHALELWIRKLNQGGILFLYLPHPDCDYWKPYKMPTRKHLHQFDPEQMKECFHSLGLQNIFCSERDLAYSFAIYGEKK